MVPSTRTVLISTLSPAHISEEAGHYVRLHTRKNLSFGPNLTILEEAHAFLASLWIDPKRQVPSISKGRMGEWERVHFLGYELGASLYQKWSKSKKIRLIVRRQWREFANNEQEAYLQLLELQGAL